MAKPKSGLSSGSVRSSQLVLFFLSRGYFASQNCLREVSATIESGDLFILVRETAAIHGGEALEHFSGAAPDWARGQLFGDERPAIAWFRQREFRFESLMRIAGASSVLVFWYRGPQARLWCSSAASLGTNPDQRPRPPLTRAANPARRGGGARMRGLYVDEPRTLLHERGPRAVPARD